MQRVLPPLRRLLRDLDLSGAGDAFAVFILSDTGAGPAADAEQQAVATFRAEDREPARIHYRRRGTNTGFKAGNIMDFLDHHAEGFELMLTLDADSEMSAAATLRLVRAMQTEPTLAIAQHLTVGLPASSAFPRLFQFGMRAGMRTWATGQAWWQGDEGPYWGHNAVVRIAPFRAHCRMPTLPDGQHILSHDQVEAAFCARRVGECAFCLTRAGRGRRTLRHCRNSSAASCVGWQAICNTGTCCACPGCGRWDAGSFFRRSCCSPARRSICCSCLLPRPRPQLIGRPPFRSRRQWR